jgi:hypothetical protein
LNKISSKYFILYYICNAHLTKKGRALYLIWLKRYLQLKIFISPKAIFLSLSDHPMLLNDWIEGQGGIDRGIRIGIDTGIDRRIEGGVILMEQQNETILAKFPENSHDSSVSLASLNQNLAVIHTVAVLSTLPSQN